MSHGPVELEDKNEAYPYPYIVGRDNGEANSYETLADAKRAAHQHIAVNGPHTALVFQRLGDGVLELVSLDD